MDERLVEQGRVNEVIDVIDERERGLHAQASGLKESVIELRKTFWDDITVNMDELDDVIETQESIKQQAALLSEKERFHGRIGEELRTLDRLKGSPYFGRIDFIEDPDQEAESIYIGIASLMDRSGEDFLIYDWRAPISSLYYDFSPGRAEYQSHDQTFTGEITLKRQFIIKHGEIEGMFDTGVTIGDEMLQHALGNNASTSMKSIVSTIQKEQNRIIRNERSKLLIVQGVAGSGKTSAALQRIAYLMYRYREDLNTDNVVLFSPNPLFSSYISNVLPELGETNVRQTTFLDYLKKEIGSKLTVESPFEQMEYVLTQSNNKRYETRRKSMDFLASLEFKEMIEAFVSSLNQKGIRFKTVSFRGESIATKQQIASYFYTLEKGFTIPNKMELVAKWLLAKIKKREQQEKDSNWVIEQMELLDKEDYMQAYYKSEEETEWTNVEDEEEILRGAMVKRAFAPLKKRVKRLAFVNIPATYNALFTKWKPEIAPDAWPAISRQIAADLAKKSLTWENATPYVYFKGCLLGSSADRAVRQLIIDEAQDYSAFQFAYIKQVFPYTRMTLLGDINQAIYTHVTKENPLVPMDSADEHERITLAKSYRSTKQIVEFTKHFAPGGDLIEAFNREGSLPRLVKSNDVTDSLLTQIAAFTAEGYETIAIICKSLQESKRIAALLKDKQQPFIQIDEETYTFEKGLLVLPVYLAKGIEFDAVIIPDASAENYGAESDRTLFYTACTRAMHALTMIIPDGAAPCGFIEEVPADEYVE